MKNSLPGQDTQIPNYLAAQVHRVREGIRVGWGPGLWFEVNLESSSRGVSAGRGLEARRGQLTVPWG